MKILFVHQNFPGQYRHLAPHLARQGHDIRFLTQREDAQLKGVHKALYAPKRQAGRETHHYLRSFEQAVLNGQAAAERLIRLRREEGWVPDLMVGHCGWGETLYLKDIYPRVPLLNYFEFYFHADGADVGFDPDNPATMNDRLRVRTRNSLFLLGLEGCDWGLTPTRWQWRQHPPEFRDRISVIHEGVDTDALKPVASQRLQVGEGGPTLSTEDEVVTYVARNLEPYRGFPTFMRAVERIAKRRPNAHFLLIGGEGVSYGSAPKDGRSYKEHMLEEVDIDPERVHFLGKVPYNQYLSVLRVSSAHVYLTFPFVLSWSLLEAMALGKAIVASRTAPVEEVITDGVNGLLADFFDPEEVADRVESVLADPDRRIDLRKAARATVQRDYDLKRVCLPRQIKLMDALSAGLLKGGPPCFNQ